MTNAESRFVSWEAAVRWLREQPEQQELILSAYYDDPLGAAAERYRNSSEWQAIRGLLAGRGGAALDIGAGRGIASYALAREGFAVTALEPDPSSLVGAGAIRQLMNDAGLAVTIVEQHSERLPFADGSFDVIFARAVLHHARDLATTCREIFRVLKPGGRLIAVREHVISRREDLPAFFALHPLHHLYGGENAYLLDDYCAALKGGGFSIQSVIKPLLSPINYFPHTRDSLRREIALRLGRIAPLSALLRGLLALPWLLDGMLHVLTYVDRRPGRLYSFVADKRLGD
ncbi:MAG TPA: methyltransferase domain-containing protein [Rhodocyclaceae bacterium]